MTTQRTSWGNDDIPVGSEYCPDCDTRLDSDGFGGSCYGNHDIACDTCFDVICDLSC